MLSSQVNTAKGDEGGWEGGLRKERFRRWGCLLGVGVVLSLVLYKVVDALTKGNGTGSVFLWFTVFFVGGPIAIWIVRKVFDFLLGFKE